ncbi:MAG: hypothetical protein LBH25_01825 [Fibromonadaceae bacterium]|nr:hypothetical protein [Fibromonadaceae bacterium]
MRTQLTKITLAAGIALAMAFTFSCSSDDGGDSGGGFDENAPILGEDGKPSNISGDIGMSGYDGYVGKATNGIVKLELPATIPEESLHEINDYYEDDEIEICTITPNDTKILESEFQLYNGGKQIGYLDIVSTDLKTYVQSINYIYANKDVNIICNGTYTTVDGWTVKNIENSNFKAGWNKRYKKSIWNESSKTSTHEYSTDNILTKDVRWHLELD